MENDKRSIEDVVDLSVLLTTLRLYRKRILFVTLSVAFAVAILSFFPKNTYVSSAILSPAQTESNSDLNALSGQFGGLAGLVGIDLGVSDGLSAQAITTLRSSDFLVGFINSENLKPIIFENKWDKENKAWKAKGAIQRVIEYFENIRGADELGTTSNEPGDWRAYKKFTKKYLTVREDPSSDFVEISIASYSPTLSRVVLEKLITRINNHYREIKREEARKSIQYLNEQLQKSSSIETQKAIYNIMEAQLKSIMLANIKDDYVFEVISPPFTPEEHSKPKRLVIIFVGLFLGFFCAYTYFLFLQLRSQ